MSGVSTRIQDPEELPEDDQVEILGQLQEERGRVAAQVTLALQSGADLQIATVTISPLEDVQRAMACAEAEFALRGRGPPPLPLPSRRGDCGSRGARISP